MPPSPSPPGVDCPSGSMSSAYELSSGLLRRQARAGQACRLGRGDIGVSTLLGGISPILVQTAAGGSKSIGAQPKLLPGSKSPSPAGAVDLSSVFGRWPPPRAGTPALPDVR